MSLGIHIGGKSAASNSATWPKMKRATRKTDDGEEPYVHVPRPQTATLERPRILDIALLGKIDMTLTRKGLISISNLVLAPIHKNDPRDSKRNGGSIKEGRGGKTRKYQIARKLTTVRHKPKEYKPKVRKPGEEDSTSVEEYDSSVSENKVSLKPKPRIPSIVKHSPREKRSPSHRDDIANNNAPSNSELKNCQRPVIPKKGVIGKRVDDVLTGPTPSLGVPEPCTACGRPEQPERFHSHPRHSAVVQASPVRRSAATKSSVRKPVAIKFRSARKPEDHEQETPAATSAKEMKAATDTPERPPHRSGPRTVMCYLCGREFGTASYPLHEPHCLQRWQRENSQLPPHLQRPLPEKPEKPLSAEEWNRFAWETSQARLIPCEHCGRTFNPDRLEVHQRSCRPGVKKVNFPSQKSTADASNSDSSSRSGSGGAVGGGSGSAGGGPRLPPTVPCYLCGRMFGSKSISIHEPQCLERWRLENSKLPPHQQRAEPVKPPSGQSPAPCPAPPPAPLHSAPTPTPVKGPPRKRVVPCYLCGREFGTASINIHEEQCVKRWRVENNKLPAHQRRPEPTKPDIKFTASGKVDFQGTMDAIWQTHLDQLVPCGQCGRTFNPDRIEIHERSCKGPKR